jgi:hypothetical protein
MRPTAGSFNNPDYVAVVIHKYRWRLGLAEGEPKYDDLEKRLPKVRISPCPPLHSKLMPMVHRTPTPVPMSRNSRADVCTGSSRAVSGTIYLGKRRASLGPMTRAPRFWHPNSRGIPRVGSGRHVPPSRPQRVTGHSPKLLHHEGSSGWNASLS